MEVKEIDHYQEKQILNLYDSVGWTAYTRDPESLKKGFQNSLLTLGAYQGEELLGLIRVVGDGETIVWIQDLLVAPQYQRQGIGTMLMKAVLDRYRHVRQVQLATDDTDRTKVFYRSVGLRSFSELGVCGFLKA